MSALRSRVLRSTLVAGATFVLAGLAVPANAAPERGDDFGPIPFAAGEGCEFPFAVSGTGGLVNTHTNGEVITTTGRGSALTFTNPATGAVFATPSTGSNQRVTPLPDGTDLVVSTGNFVIILFSTDPGGPSTTLHHGRVVYIDDNGEFTILSSAGSETDVCAALSS